MRKYLLKADLHDARDSIYGSQRFDSAEKLPLSVDLRAHMSPIVDQGELGSCTANAIASGLREYLELKNGRALTRLSRLFLYWHERKFEGTVNEDSGAYIRDGMKVLQQIGVCPERDYPYVIGHFTATPTPKAEADASAFKISTYQRVLNLQQLKASLAEGYPVVVGISVYESFESKAVAETGQVPMPNMNREQLLGGHAVLAVGYGDAARHVIIRNSWGAGWGDKGYCYMPYAYFTTPGLVSDMWTGR
jgi:C1A family cysteine protease